MSSTPTPLPPELERLSKLENLRWSGESRLPVPPQSVIEFSCRARKPDVTVGELSAVVECEPALTMELLRNVNSCVRGLRYKVDSVSQAIILLGIPNSTTILLTSALSNAIERMDSPLIPSADFRRETVERAIFAREAARCVRVDSTLSYTAAMLQDILLPMLTRQHQVEYHEYLHGGQYSSIVDFERERFGWTHPELTAKTLLKWGFSHTLALAVLHHHDSPEKMLTESEHPPLEFPVSASALLMDVLNQSPDGVTRLVDMQAIQPDFHVIELAGAVDDAVRELNSTLHHPVSLVHRLQNAMLNQIEQRRKQSVACGRQFGNYVLEDKLKESSMGTIYRARHTRLRRPAAVKVLRAERTTGEAIVQFEKEVQLTSSLRHPNTVAIFDYGHTPDDLFYYAMELIDGLTLAELVKQEGRLPDGRVISILQQACGSLSEAHGLEVIHRDIKPENIMISQRASRPDHVTVLDFGLVTSTKSEAGDTSDQLRGVVGTPLYMSPEAAYGQDQIDLRSDLYSIGAVGYYLLTGMPLFSGRSVVEVLQQHMRSTPPPPSERCDSPISPELERLLMQCLKKSPRERPASAEAIAEALSRCVPCTPWSADDAQNWWNDYQIRRANAVDETQASLETIASTLVTTDFDSVHEAERRTHIAPIGDHTDLEFASTAVGVDSPTENS